MMIVFIVLLVCIVGAFVCNYLYKRTNHFCNQFIDVKKFQDQGVSGLDLVNLGSNHPKFGFDYSETNINAENWAVGPQTLEYDFAILKKNVNRLNVGATVVIPICLLKMFLFRQEDCRTHLKYYSFLSESDIVGYSRWEYFKELQFPMFFHPLNLRYLIKDQKKDERLKLENNPISAPEQLEKDADSWINCWNREFNIELPSPILSEKNKADIRQNIEILHNMLNFCVEHQLKPVIAILPVTKYLSSKFTDDFIENHIMKYIQEANIVNAPVMNYLKDERFTDESLYINSFFMNRIGARKFTKQVLTDLGLI